jgi:hypothetical protein
MSSDFQDDLLVELQDLVDETIIISHEKSDDSRFTFTLNKAYEFFDLKSKIIGSQARVLCLLNLSNLNPKIQERVLALMFYDNEGSYSGFDISLWNRDKDYKKLPAIETLLNTEGLHIEFSSKPCLINDLKPASTAVIQITNTFIRWFENDVLELYSDLSKIEEGSPIEVHLTRYERSKINRRICLKHHGYSCSVCGINLKKIYGERANCFIHVHHLDMLATSEAKIVDPINDLIPVCPNCHCIIHRTKVPATPDEIRELIKQNKGESNGLHF